MSLVVRSWMSRNWVTVPSWATWMKPGRSTTKRRGSPGGEVTKTGWSKLGPIDCRPSAEARAGAHAITIRHAARSAKRTLALIPTHHPPSAGDPIRAGTDLAGLVPVVVALVGALDRNADVGGLVRL